MDRRSAFRAGVAYTLVVFAFAFGVGVVRVLLVAPRVGAVPAVLIEAPIVLGASWIASTWFIRRFNVIAGSRVRALMGAVAFSLLMLLELALAVLIFGESPGAYLEKFASTSGVIGLAMQIGFAAIPWIQYRLERGRGAP